MKLIKRKTKNKINVIEMVTKEQNLWNFTRHEKKTAQSPRLCGILIFVGDMIRDKALVGAYVKWFFIAIIFFNLFFLEVFTFSHYFQINRIQWQLWLISTWLTQKMSFDFFLFIHVFLMEQKWHFSALTYALYLKSPNNLCLPMNK